MRNIILVNYWGLPYALHMKVCRDFEHELPCVSQAFLRNESAKEHFQNGAKVINNARSLGYRTVCLGVTEWDPPSDRKLVECTQRFLGDHGVEHASCWSTFPWRSLSHDKQIIDEACQILNQDADRPLLLLVNLLACRDILFMNESAGSGPFFEGTAACDAETDRRIIPENVNDPGVFSRAWRQCVHDFKNINCKILHLLSLAREKDCHIGMTALSSYSIGEHGAFGESIMKEGTTSFFASTKPFLGNASYVDDAIREFVMSCLENRPVQVSGDFPFESRVGRGATNPLQNKRTTFRT